MDGKPEPPDAGEQGDKDSPPRITPGKGKAQPGDQHKAQAPEDIGQAGIFGKDTQKPSDPHEPHHSQEIQYQNS